MSQASNHYPETIDDLNRNDERQSSPADLDRMYGEYLERQVREAIRTLETEASRQPGQAAAFSKAAELLRQIIN